MVHVQTFNIMIYNKDLYPFQSRWVEIDKHRIHYIDEGQGQVILFSHPALASSFMYREFIRILSKNFRCIALDYPGFGLSSDDPKEKYSIATQSYILSKFIDKLELTDIVGLGHDTGGPSLFKLVADEPDRFRGLILTDTLIFPTKEYGRIHKMLGVVGSGPFQWLNAWTNLIIRLMLRFGIPTRKLTKPEKNQYASLFSTPHKRRRITQMLVSLKQHQTFMEQIKTAFTRQLNAMPLLLIYGEKDPVNQLGIPQRIKAMTQHTELYLIKGEGHFPHEGQPEEMSQLMSQWLHTNIPQSKSSQLQPIK